MAYTYKIFEAVNLTFHGHYTHVYNVQSYWLNYRKQTVSAKQRIHKCSVMTKKDMVAKCIVHIHITAELKAYWLTCLC